MQATQEIRSDSKRDPRGPTDRGAGLRAALSALADPAEAEFLATLRALLASVLADPGRLVNPVYVGPLLQPSVLKQDIETAAGALGLRLVARHEIGVRAGDAPGVALLTEQEADRLAQYGVRSAERVQVVIWGRKAARDLAPALGEWVRAGIGLNPHQGTLAATPGLINDQLSRMVVAGPTQPRCVVWVGDPPSLPRRAAEARVRLDLAGCGPVSELGTSVAGPPAAGAASLVASFPGTMGAAAAAHTWGQVQAALQQGRRAVIVTDAGGESALRNLCAANPAPAELLWAWDADSTIASQPLAWPDLDDALIGPAFTSVARDELSIFSLRTLSMGEVLKAPALQGKSGVLVVFEPSRLGWLRLANGEIRDVRRVQENRAVGTALEVVARVRDLARWTDARAIFIPGATAAGASEPSGGCRIPLEAVAFDLMSQGSNSSGFASREQSPDQVAAALAAFGLLKEAVTVLTTAERQQELGPAGARLLASFQAAAQPAAAVESYRRSVELTLRGASEPADLEPALDAGLNALLVEVRAGSRSAASAWSLFEQAGLVGAEALGLPARVGVALELAVRVSRQDVVTELASWLRSEAEPAIAAHWLAFADSLPFAAAPPPADPAAETVLQEAHHG